MGFKRTSEGRVFFHSGDEAPGAVKKADFRNISTPASTGISAGQTTQFQILSLLKALNEKLKDSQAERRKMKAEIEAYRKTVEGLEDKAGRNERAYQELEQKLGKPDKTSAAKAERAEKLAEDLMKELTETRKLILDLEDKADKADKGVLTLQRQMGQTRAIGEEVVRRQEIFDALVSRVEAAENRHEDLAQQLEKTAGEQARIMRQIEKVAEDRARFMRKIERIEETVIQTRDALTARAMVLLTDNGKAAKLEGSNPDSAEPSPLAEQVVAGVRLRNEKASSGARSFAFQATVAITVLTLGVLGGWAASKVQQARFADIGNFTVTDNAAPDESSYDIASESMTQTPEENTPEIVTEDSTPQYSDELAGPFRPENLAENTENTPSVPADFSKVDDIGTLDLNDEKKVLEMLESDPDAVAEKLNAIEPSNDQADAMPMPVVPQQVVEATEKPAEKPSQKPVETQTQKPVETANADEPAKVASSPHSAGLSKDQLRSLMKPDSTLPPQAKRIEEKAYDGVPEAQHDLAAIYTVGQGGAAQDYKRAAFWFEQAANGGIANAAYNLGVLNHQGLGMKPDVRTAIKWYKEAADLGHPEAQYNLGIAYIEGVGVGYDPAQAAANFESAARQGITEASYNLGLIYENGLLGKPEPDKALKWYKTAADNGSPEAKEALEQLAKTLDIKIEDVNRIAEGM